MTVKKIDQLVPLQLYACVFRGERENILLKKTRELTDSVKVREFFKNNKYKISNYLQKEYGLSHEDYSKWAREAINQAKSFFKRINQLICNAQNGERWTSSESLKSINNSRSIRASRCMVPR